MNFSKFLALLVVCAVFLSANVVFASDVSDFNATDAGINDHIGAVPVSKDVDSYSNFVNVSSSGDFKKAMGDAHSVHVKYGNHVLNLTKKNYNFNTGDDVLFYVDHGDVVVMGNGATLSCNGATFFNVGKNVRLSLCNLTFTGCKPAIRSYGEVVAYNVTFVDNQRFDTVNSPGLMREGGAIDNFAD